MKEILEHLKRVEPLIKQAYQNEKDRIEVPEAYIWRDWYAVGDVSTAENEIHFKIATLRSELEGLIRMQEYNNR